MPPKTTDLAWRARQFDARDPLVHRISRQRTGGSWDVRPWTAEESSACSARGAKRLTPSGSHAIKACRGNFEPSQPPHHLQSPTRKAQCSYKLALAPRARPAMKRISTKPGEAGLILESARTHLRHSFANAPGNTGRT